MPRFRRGRSVLGSEGGDQERMRRAQVVAAAVSRARKRDRRTAAAASMPPVMNPRRTATSVSWSMRNMDTAG